MIFLYLFYTFCKIGLFGFGGGYAMLSMIQGEVVTRYNWISASEFTDIIPAIDDMDADVITFEASRSDLQILDSLKENHFETEVGPGVYDIHSPRVPSVEEIVKALHAMLTKIDKDKLWVNPDCGLKTRGVPETDASLRNMVAAAKQIREEV